MVVCSKSFGNEEENREERSLPIPAAKTSSPGYRILSCVNVSWNDSKIVEIESVRVPSRSNRTFLICFMIPETEESFLYQWCFGTHPEHLSNAKHKIHHLNQHFPTKTIRASRGIFIVSKDTTSGKISFLDKKSPQEILKSDQKLVPKNEPKSPLCSQKKYLQ
jgi:hypothetical protein